ncbi:hypothetical protein CTA2_2256 [Colletotrichum tanaceti]|uniref:Uncharacterized protein n=1 Tax=Colletotrichum tanaceti TaxID=1306861 RepID=A0A4U6XVP9_9PEZI|nr:hypothetical protein CTA2_2256 [Colletotrichum tanaceti]TKW60153.1 hypothetical protein CTA1_4717 [Colletotrichum tanaceti]
MSTSQVSVVFNGHSTERPASNQQHQAAETQSRVAKYLEEHRDLYQRLHADKSEDERTQAHRDRASNVSQEADARLQNKAK